MALLNGEWLAGLIPLNEALNRRLPYWELGITEWGKAFTVGDLQTVNNVFSIDASNKVPAVRAIAIAPYSTVHRVRATIAPAGSLAEAGPNQADRGVDEEITVDSPWVAPTVLPTADFGVVAPNRITISASAATQYTDVYVPFGSAASVPFGSAGAGVFYPPCLRLLFFFRDVPTIYPKRAPLMGLGTSGTSTGVLTRPSTMFGISTGVTFTNVETLVKVYPIMGRRKIRVTVAPVGGTNVNVRLGGVVSTRQFFDFGPPSLISVEHQYMAATLATNTAPLTRYIDTDPAFPFLTIYMAGVGLGGTAQLVIDAVD